MTISEASATNILLSALFGPLDDRGDAMPPTARAIAEAATYLAERSHKALGAGWDSRRVEERSKETP